MPPYIGTIIANTVFPATTEDTIAVAYAEHIKGGHHQVDSLAARDAIFPDRRAVNMLVTVASGEGGVKTTYTLAGGIENSNWQIVPDIASVVVPIASDDLPKDLLATATAGVSDAYSRADHAHLLPEAWQVGAVTLYDLAETSDITAASRRTGGIIVVREPATAHLNMGDIDSPDIRQLAIYGRTGLLSAATPVATDPVSTVVTLGYIGTSATLDVGTSAGNVVQLDDNGFIPESILPVSFVANFSKTVFIPSGLPTQVSDAKRGDLCVRYSVTVADRRAYVLTEDNPSVSGDWYQVVLQDHLFIDANPADMSLTPSPGTSEYAARLDHIHRLPTASELGGTVMHHAADQPGRLALAGVNIGDQCLQADNGKIYVATGLPASNPSNWQELLTSASSTGVTSVNGETGAVNTVKIFPITGDGSTKEWTITHDLGRVNIQTTFLDDASGSEVECLWSLSGANEIKVSTSLPIISARKINVLIS